jgi:hypothetical protein
MQSLTRVGKNSCNVNSTCMPIFNQNNSYYCSCKSGYYGKDYSLYESRCEIYCLANAFYRSNAYDLEPKTNSPYCICSLDRFGPRCNLKHDDCDSNPCLNNGTCLSTNDQSGETSYACVCSKRFYADRCQYEMGSVRVNLNMINASFARAIVVQLYDIGTPSFQLLIQHQQVYHGFSTTINYYHSAVFAPYLRLLKIYEDLTYPRYFIMYILYQSVINITSSPQHCPHASSLLSRGKVLYRQKYSLEIHFYFQIRINLFQSSSNTIISVEMTLNVCVFMMKHISVYWH